jgi:molybdopterin molybdotransferase
MDADRGAGANLPLEHALAAVRAAADVLTEPQAVPLLQALGRRLATDVRSDVPWPVTDRSAMDGFALAAGAGGAAAGTELAVVGESLAGRPFRGRLQAGQAIRIMTGAVVPPGADAVAAVEATSGFGGATVRLTAGCRSGQNVRRAGSELAPGALVLAAGTRIRSAEIGALAVLGIDPVPVFARARVAILSTGDEVVDVARVPAAHQVRDSNGWALAAQVLEAGGEPVRLGIAADTREDLTRLLRRALDEADVVLTIGGVSKGTHDLVHVVLEQLGVAKVFHGIQLKPGMPTFFGLRRGGARPAFAFGLPGNPASCYTVFDLLVRPLLARVMGARDDEAPPPHARLDGQAFAANKRLQAIPARLQAGSDCVLRAALAAPRSSGDPFSLLAADGYVLVPAQAPPAATPSAPVRGYGAGLAL